MTKVRAKWASSRERRNVDQRLQGYNSQRLKAQVYNQDMVNFGASQAGFTAKISQ